MTFFAKSPYYFPCWKSPRAWDCRSLTPILLAIMTSAPEHCSGWPCPYLGWYWHDCGPNCKPYLQNKSQQLPKSSLLKFLYGVLLRERSTCRTEHTTYKFFTLPITIKVHSPKVLAILHWLPGPCCLSPFQSAHLAAVQTRHIANAESPFVPLLVLFVGHRSTFHSDWLYSSRQLVYRIISRILEYCCGIQFIWLPSGPSKYSYLLCWTSAGLQGLSDP